MFSTADEEVPLSTAYGETPLSTAYGGLPPDDGYRFSTTAAEHPPSTAADDGLYEGEGEGDPFLTPFGTLLKRSNERQKTLSEEF